MKLARLILLVLAIAAPASRVHAAGFCGFAYNFANASQAKVLLKRYRVGESSVEARLVCQRWRTICNGRAGRIQFHVGAFPITSAPILQGTLRYGRRLSCSVFCQVDGTVEAPNMLFCQFNCPAGAAARQVSFTVGPTACQ
jgi:hypothetical protein